MRPLLKLRSVRILLITLPLVALYAVGGFLLAPKLLRDAIVTQTKKNLGVDAAVGELRFNPFSLELVAKDLVLRGADGHKLAGFGRLFVDFEISSLWHRAFVFKEIDLSGPFAHAIVAADGRLNLVELEPKSTAPQSTAPKTATSMPRLEIGRFQVSDASLSYDDFEGPRHLSIRLEPIAFELRDFSTDAAGGTFSFTGSTPLRERIAWSGRLSVQPIASQGDIAITDLRARTLSTYLADRLGSRIGFALRHGRIGVTAHYLFSLQHSVQLHVDATANVADLAVSPRGLAAPWITLPSLRIGGAGFDLAARRAHVDRVELKGLGVDARLDAHHQLNLMALAGTPPAPRRSAAVPAAAQPPQPAQPWQVDVGQLSIHDAHLAVQDLSVRPEARFVLAPWSLDLDGVNLDPSKPVGIRFVAAVAGGHIAAHGTLVRAPLSASLAVEASHLDLRGVQPYIAQHASLTLRRGLLGGDLQLSYHHGGPALKLAGNLRIDSLRTVDNALHEDLVNWRRLDVRGLSLQLSPDRLSVKKVVAVEPYARVIVEPDRTLNVRRILTGPGPVPTVVAAQPVAAPPTDRRPPMRITIGAVDIQKGQANFSDLSISPNFSSGIDKLSGDLTGLDSRPGSRAKIDLHGEVGPYAPVSITGEVNLFGPTLYTDVAMSFRNMDLTVFNPYAGKFAGYNITKGKLATELHYHVVGRKLDATHHIIIDQLEFGPKTASKDAVSLPIKLAVALLKDRNGVIDLNLPVTGSLDDPKFRLGPLIWHVLVNLLEKAVTAPFKLLGALFGAGPQMQYVHFHPGDATLDAADLARMQSLAKALDARPQLKVDVPIAPLAALDQPALAQAEFDREIAAERAALGRPNKKPPARLAVLSALYQKAFGAPPRFAKPAVPPKSAADAAQLRIDDLEARLMGRIKVDDAELKTLAEQRAMAVEKALLGGTGVDPARVFLVVNGKVDAHAGAVRLQLSLK